jgi:hypothetical protein
MPLPAWIQNELDRRGISAGAIPGALFRAGMGAVPASNSPWAGGLLRAGLPSTYQPPVPVAAPTPAPVAARPAVRATPTTWQANDMYGGGPGTVTTPQRAVAYSSPRSYPKDMTGGTAPGSFDYRAMKKAEQGTPSGKVYIEGLGWVDPEEFMTGLGALGGGGADNSVAWAQMEMERQQWQDRMRLEEQQMAQAAELARLEREQRAREMAAGIGQFLANQSSQNWNAGLPWTLPKGTQYAPGFEPGGPAARLAQMSGSQYTPPPLAVSNPPSRETMAAWVDEALQQFAR